MAQWFDGALRFDDFVDGPLHTTRIAWLYRDLFVVLCIRVLGLRCDEDSSEVYGQLSRHSSSNKMYSASSLRRLSGIFRGFYEGDARASFTGRRSGVRVSGRRSNLGQVVAAQA